MAQDENEQAQAGGSDGGDAGQQQGGGQLDVQSMTDYAMEMIQDQAKNHPWRTVGVAMGLGYVIGGGVPKFLVRLGMLAAGRVMADAITTEGLRSLSSNLGMGQDEGDEQAQSGETPRAKNGHHRKRGQGGERQARRA